MIARGFYLTREITGINQERTAAMEDRKTVLIRTDGNPDIATGHLMRCLSIASALRELGAQVEFAVSDPVSAGLLASFFEKENFPVHVLHTDYRKPDAELPALKRLLENGAAGQKDGRFRCLLIDSYFVTPPYLEELRRLLPTAYLDDLRAFDCPADLVINYDFLPPRDFYSQAGRTLLGGQYTPLRGQFSGLAPAFRERVGSLLISTGGTDACNVAGRLASFLLHAPPSASWRIHALTGPMHAHRQELAALAARESRLQLHENVKDMAYLMEGCDLAVSAAGTTLYELCAAGVPAVSFTLADNQLSCARDMQRFAGVPCAGDARQEKEIIETLASLLFSLAENREKRDALARSMHAAVDGKGAQRIARALLAL